jgi:hypothetical protein
LQEGQLSNLSQAPSQDARELNHEFDNLTFLGK